MPPKAQYPVVDGKKICKRCRRQLSIAEFYLPDRTKVFECSLVNRRAGDYADSRNNR